MYSTVIKQDLLMLSKQRSFINFFLYWKLYFLNLNREVPTIIHSLNLVPTQGEMRDLITEVKFYFCGVFFFCGEF